MTERRRRACELSRFCRGSQDLQLALLTASRQDSQSLGFFGKYHSENLNEMLPR